MLLRALGPCLQGLLPLSLDPSLALLSHSLQNFRARVAAPSRRLLHTNGARVVAEDPYKTLGIEFGSTTEEIKVAYRALAKRHHPDLFSSQTGSDSERLANEATFRKITAAYNAVMAKANVDLTGEDATLYSFQLWRKADMLAQERTDVAGVKRVRPARPAGEPTSVMIDFSGTVPVAKRRGGDLIGGEPGVETRTSSSVGRGQSKWSKAKPYEPWKPMSNAKDSKEQDEEMGRTSLRQPRHDEDAAGSSENSNLHDIGSATTAQTTKPS